MPIGLSPREIKRESADDPELASVCHYVQTGDWSQCSMPGYTCVKHELCITGKLALSRDRIVIPQSLRKVVLELDHEGHQSVVKMKSRLRTKLWWPKMDGDMEGICQSCHGCQVTGQYSPPELMPGDQVLLKNTRETGKLPPKFKTKLHTVLTKEGHQVIVESSKRAVYKRDSLSVKLYLSVSEPEPATESVPVNTKSEDKPGVVGRPRRIIRPPKRFKDYVLGKPRNCLKNLTELVFIDFDR